MSGDSKDDKRRRGVTASSADFTRYDQVNKPKYHLAESADGADVFDEDFEFATCDLGRFLHGDAGDRRQFADGLGEAMRDIGFAVLEGHGIDAALIARAEDWVEEFFTTTDLAHKMQFRAARHGAVSEGYFPIEQTSDIHPDQVEGWVFGRRAFDLPGTEQPFDASLLWPRPEFEPKFRQLVEAKSALILPVMRSILMGIGVDPTLFDKRLHNANLGSRLNYYHRSIKVHQLMRVAC